MMSLRAIGLAAAATCMLSLQAGAQMMGPGFGMPGAAPQSVPPCIANFVPLREEAQKRGLAIKAAAERKAPREELCTLFKRFADAEAKVVKYVQANKAECKIPNEAAKDMQQNHSRTITMRQRVCAAGAAAGPEGGPPRPSGPGLSEALGTQRLQLDVPAGGRGTFDTLSGNVLQR